MKKFLTVVLLAVGTIANSQTYPPGEGQPGSTAIEPTDSRFVAWANGASVQRGFVNIANPAGGYVSAGISQNAIGQPDGAIVSLGDRGNAVVTFAVPIINGPGFDFAVFENGLSTFLELAFVEVSSNGINFFRFPAHSQTQTATQIGAFETPLPQYLNNLAGKYASNGTPFDLSDIPDNALLDKNNITHVKIIDVVGSINPLYASYDSFGNMINEPWPTAFESGGFDLDAVGVIHKKVLGVEDFRKENIYIYPNPASDFIFTNLKTDFETIIFDISGRIVLRQKSFGADGIAISNLNSGIYLVEISSEGKKNTIHLVKK